MVAVRAVATRRTDSYFRVTGLKMALNNLSVWASGLERGDDGGREARIPADPGG